MVKFNIKIIILSIILCFQGALFADLLPLERDNIRVFKRISPYVVNVHRLKSAASGQHGQQGVMAGVGSGFLWNRAGYVVTNAHVVGAHHWVAVTLVNGKSVKAKVLETDARKDIALLKLTSTRSLPRGIAKGHIPVMNSNELVVGQLAIAIGNPYGLSQTFTEGVVSALNRDMVSSGVMNTSSMIQTDASINPGNSGGPLLDSQGRLIGMNALIYSRSGSSSGIGFAIPSNAIKQTVDSIMRYGKVSQPGIGIVPVNDMIARRVKSPGVIISKVLKGTPAYRAGLRGLVHNEYGNLMVGDIIIGINGKRVKSVGQYLRVLDKIGVNKTMVVHVLRGRKQFRVKIKAVDLS